MLIPHSYQAWAVQSIWDYFSKNSGNPIVVLPTGAGKSIVQAEFAKSALNYYPSTKILGVTHVQELIQQNYEEMIGQWPTAPAGIYSAGLDRRDRFCNIIFCGVKSVVGKEESFGRVDLLLIDECHLVSDKEASQYRTLISNLRKINPYLKVVGFTATPWRTGKGLLTEGDDSIFTDICCDMGATEPFNWLVEQGFLMPLVSKRTETEWDADSLKTVAGEYSLTEMENLFNGDDAKTWAALQEAAVKGHDRKSWLVFSSGIKHGERIVEMLTLMGVKSAFVHGKMKKDVRREIIAAYKRGEYKALVNYGILTTGFNHKPLDMIVVLRATKSVVLWGQILGRGTRCVYAAGFDLSTFEGRIQAIAAGGKDYCLVLDFGRNTPRLGPINDPVIPMPKGKSGPKPAPWKECPACGSYNHTRATFCGGKDPSLEPIPSGFCGHKFIIETKTTMSSCDVPVMKTAVAPVMEVFKVDHIVYNYHQKAGSPAMVQVHYHCGLRRFTKHVCVEHTNAAKGFAKAWWKLRSSLPMPETAYDLLGISSTLPQPTHIRVWTNNKPYPQIMAECFDGSAFGTMQRSTDEQKTDALMEGQL